MYKPLLCLQYHIFKVHFNTLNKRVDNKLQITNDKISVTNLQIFNIYLFVVRLVFKLQVFSKYGQTEKKDK